MTVVKYDLERENAALLDQVRELRSQNKVRRSSVLVPGSECQQSRQHDSLYSNATRAAICPSAVPASE